MSVLNDIPITVPEEKPIQNQPVKIKTKSIKTEDVDDVEDDEYDNSDKHPKLKTFLLITLMLVGLGLFVWNMTNFVNHMRLDNQGSASNIVYEMQDLNNFMGNSDGSGATKAEDTTESKVSADAPRDGPTPEDNHSDSESNDVDSLRKELEDTKNEMALKELELKNAEDMLDSALKKLEGTSGNK